MQLRYICVLHSPYTAREAVIVTDSRNKAIRIIIATAAVSLLLSAICAAAFIMNMTGMFKNAEPVPARDNFAVYVSWCASEAEEAECALSV